MVKDPSIPSMATIQTNDEAAAIALKPPIVVMKASQTNVD
jgi:hypothetical protein